MSDPKDWESLDVWELLSMEAGMWQKDYLKAKRRIEEMEEVCREAEALLHAVFHANARFEFRQFIRRLSAAADGEEIEPRDPPAVKYADMKGWNP